MNRQSHRSGWLWLCGWLLATGFVGWHAAAVERYLDRVTATQFSDGAVATPLRRVPQAVAPDGQVWVRHAITLAESGAWRLRSTEIDNAPEGRPIYWNSGWALWLEACGRLRAAITREPLATAMEGASLWANLPLFLVVLTLASGWVWWRWGGAAGALMALGLAGHRGFYTGFYPAYCDHHGVINACGLGVVLGAVMAGGGWWRRAEGVEFSMMPKSERAVMRAATVSAVCGALGLWVSAASMVVTIGFTGLAVLLAGLIAPGEGLRCVPEAWRRWGRVGALLSVGLYLGENFPDRLGFRLEANHPLYALAWWGAGEAIAVVLTARLESRARRWLAVRVLGWGALVAAAPLVVLMQGAAVFAPIDPFLGRVHSSIYEFQPFLVDMNRAGWATYRDQVWIMVWVALLTGVWATSKPGREERGVVILAGSVALASLALGVYQSRWLLTAAASQVLLAVILTRLLAARARGWGVALLATAAVVVCGLGPWTLVKERLLVERVRDVQLGETVQLLYRDIAGALRRAGADGKSIVLSDPNASVGVGYYGQLRAVGTLYWENRDGLLAAAEILEAHDDAEAAGRIFARGITHVVMVSSYDFLAEYNFALRGGSGPMEDREAFGYRLLYRKQVPVWLRPLNYEVPRPLVPLGFKVAIFAVDFETPPSVAYERIGRYQLSQGELSLAEKNFLAAVAAAPSRPEPYLRLGELALMAGRLSEAYQFIRAGIERSPIAQRERLVKSAVAMFRLQGAEGVQRAESLLSLLVP